MSFPGEYSDIQAYGVFFIISILWSSEYFDQLAICSMVLEQPLHLDCITLHFLMQGLFMLEFTHFMLKVTDLSLPVLHTSEYIDLRLQIPSDPCHLGSPGRDLHSIQRFLSKD